MTAATDVCVYIYQTAVLGQAKPVSYPAHIAGAASGLLVGVICLRNLSWERHQKYIWVFCLVLYTLLVSVAVVWNILAEETKVHNIIQLLDLDCSQFIL